MIRAQVTQGNKTRVVSGEKGMTVMAILHAAGIFIDAPCGGRGRCGKCKVKVSGSVRPPCEGEKKLLSPALLADGFRLACRAVAEGDISVFLPEMRTVEIEAENKIGCPFDPPVTVFADGDRFEVDYLGQKIAATDSETAVGATFDIGTTTLAASFFDLKNAKHLGTRTLLNPQRRYGADVISRIAACAEDCEKLTYTLREALGQMIDDFCKESGLSKESIYHCTVAGNTVMLHFAAGISPEGMARSPFKPATLFGTAYAAKDVGIPANSGARAYFLPCVSGFVGGDITAGLLACGFDRLERPALFIDIGTNGEMALLCGDEILCCSTAAGPAFEGAHIACGTGSVAGAVNRVKVQGKSLTFGTIGGEKPIGICGSGLIDAVAALLDLGLLDETGALETGLTNEKDEAYYPIGDTGLYITQRDIREVQLAKSAIASGLETLLEKSGLNAADIGEVFIAGGFGTRMNAESACRIGLLPREFQSRARSCGNTALKGASMLLLDRKSLRRIDDIARRCRLVELAGDAFFEERFIENMLFEC